MIEKIIFLEIVSALAIFYGFKSRRKYKEKWDKMSEKQKSYRGDVQIDINGIIILGVLGVLGGFIILIRGL